MSALEWTRRGRIALLALTLGFATGAQVADAEQHSPQVSTRFGPMRGTVEDGVNVFKGIPYGAPTGGANRFRPPKTPKPWTAVRDATLFGDRCPQLSGPTGNGAWSSWVEPTHASENCLVLNIWTPGVGDHKRRPVMVWLHGGGYSVSSGASSVFDGTHLAQRGDVVVVTLNHRLNLFGYLYLGGIAGPEYADSGNVGQLDIIAALRWIQDNIAEFGGDPAAVMIFGESGGGGKVGTLMAMPAAQGLFHRAAMQSGFAVTALSAQAAQQMTNSLLAALHLRRGDVSRLQTIGADKLLAALQQVTHGMPFGLGPVVDGRSLPRHPFAPDAPDVSAEVPLLVGYNKDETTALFPPAGAFDLDWSGLETLLLAQHIGGDVAPLLRRLREIRPWASPSDLYFTITTERGMGRNARAVAERKAALGRAPVYLYKLDWSTPVEGGRLRTPHSLDVPLVFDNVGRSESLIGSAAQDAQRVADAMSAAWLAFARNGSPNAPGLPSWPRFDAEQRATMVFNTVSRAVNDPLYRERQLLAPVTPAPASP
ncbi:MAG: carboxylesterase/lipase family protein [Steroidobacteraceae bacterium]